MKKFKTIIVEDEVNNAELLKHFINKYCSSIDLIEICTNIKDAVAAISKHKPDLLFLDIILEDDTAFDLLEEIEYKELHIIFVTAFDEYALKAFRFNAADYLLKPVQIDELISAVNRIQEREVNRDFLKQEQILDISENIRKPKTKLVTISNIDKVSFLKNEEILYCKSSGRYTEFYLKDKRKLVASKSLGEYEEELDENNFYRIHKSFIVNLNCIEQINKKAGNYCDLSDGSSLPISRRRLDGLLQFLKKM